MMVRTGRLKSLALNAGLPQEGLVALYRLGGVDAGLNPSAVWTDRKRNLADWSEDLTNAIYTHDAATNSATLLTFSAQNQSIYQPVTTLDAASYTLSFKARAVTGNTALHFLHTNSATGNSTALTVTATLTRYSVSVLGKSGGGAVNFGIQDQNASGFGQIEITEFQVSPGATLLDYEKTEANQRIWDYSGNGNHATRGSTSGADTNDPSFAVEGGLIVGMGFDGNDDAVVRATTPVLTQPFTLIVVHKTTNAAARRFLFDGDEDTDRCMVYFETDNLTYLNANIAISVGASTLGSYQMFSALFNGAASRYYRNLTGATVSGSVGTAQLSGYTIGARYSLGSSLLGNESVFAAYNRVLSDAEITRIYNLIKKVQPELSLP